MDAKSVASHNLTLYAYSQRVGSGTGFVVRVSDHDFLVSNYHVLSGRHPTSGQLLDGVPATPDRVLIPVLRRAASLSWRPLVQALIDQDGNPLWVEHPRWGPEFDVVALPVRVPRDAQLVQYPQDPGPKLAMLPGSELAIIGFPEGMTASGVTAIWKSGSVASEPHLSLEDEPFFWIDSNTRRGMSGSPVIARRFGGALMEDGNYSLHTGIVDRTVGVYAGRALDAPDMTLGRVWKWEGVSEILDEAVSRVHRGILSPVPCEIGHYEKEDKAMVELDISKSVEVTARTPAGAVEVRQVTVAEILREFVLGDDRFGMNLDRVRMGAAIEASVASAQKDGKTVKLDDEQYGLVRETITAPTKAYNAAVARAILPLLDYMLEAGKAKK